MQKCRIGTRGSKLALIQTERVKSLLEKNYPNTHFEVIILKTDGDLHAHVPIHVIGGKGAFVKNIEKALVDQEIDIAVHSLKDITSRPLEELELSGFLQAEACTDALILRKPYRSISELPTGAKIATGSMRRRAQLKKLNPAISFVEIRGNVDSRLKKLEEGTFDGLMLSEAGLMRLGQQGHITQRFTPKQFCPAPGQGVIVIQNRRTDQTVTDMIQSVNDWEQSLLATTELAFLERLQFDCQTPLGAHATRLDDQIEFQVFVSNPSFTHLFEKQFKFHSEQRLQEARRIADEVLKWIKINP